MSHHRIVVFVLLALAAGAACADPPARGAAPVPRVVMTHEGRPEERSLADAVRRVERSTGGQILSAERVPFDGRDMNRIKVLDPSGRVRVITEDSRSRPPRGDRD